MLILIEGNKGVGKTSLAVSFIIKAMDDGEEQLERARASLEFFPGYKNIPLPKNHLVYTDIDARGSEISLNDNKPHVSTGFRFGLPNNDFVTDYIPYGSLVVYDEARKYWPARKSMLTYEKGGTHEKTLEAFELSRHNGLDVILICHKPNHIDKNIMNLADMVIVPYEFSVELIGDKLKFETSIWKCRIFESNIDYELWLNGNKNIKFEEKTYTFKGNIFDHYDSEYFRFKFLAGLERYSENDLEDCDGTKESVERLNKLYTKREIKDYDI